MSRYNSPNQPMQPNASLSPIYPQVNPPIIGEGQQKHSQVDSSPPILPLQLGLPTPPTFPEPSAPPLEEIEQFGTKTTSSELKGAATPQYQSFDPFQKSLSEIISIRDTRHEQGVPYEKKELSTSSQQFFTQLIKTHLPVNGVLNQMFNNFLATINLSCNAFKVAEKRLDNILGTDIAINLIFGPIKPIVLSLFGGSLIISTVLKIAIWSMPFLLTGFIAITTSVFGLDPKHIESIAKFTTIGAAGIVASLLLPLRGFIHLIGMAGYEILKILGGKDEISRRENLLMSLALFQSVEDSYLMFNSSVLSEYNRFVETQKGGDTPNVFEDLLYLKEQGLNIYEKTLSLSEGTFILQQYKETSESSKKDLNEKRLSDLSQKGIYIDGKLYGKGSLRDKEGTIYEGIFFNGKLHGEGGRMIEKGEKGEVIYDGTFENGLFIHGKKTFKNSSNEMEEQIGDFKNRNLSKGVLKRGKNYFEGTFKVDSNNKVYLLNGEATLQYDDGKYIGKVRNDNWFQGKWIGNDGSIEEGEFDRKILLSGTVKNKRFNDGTYTGKIFYKLPNDEGGIWVGKNGAKFEGKFRDGKLNGKAKQSYPDGTIIEGEFSNGKLKKGTWSDGEGDVYSGDFENDKLQGLGTFKDNKTGIVYEGYFYDNALIKDKNGKLIFESDLLRINDLPLKIRPKNKMMDGGKAGT